MPTALWAENGERFMRKLDINGEGGCWPWIAAVDKVRSNGIFRVKLADGKSRNASHHVASWLLFYGEPPSGKSERIGATCKNLLCCNPHHLFIEKMKGRGVTTRSRLTYEQKIEKKFWEHVAPSDDLECLLYTPARPSGYAMIYMLADGKRTGMPAHRYAMQLRHGPIPRDVLVTHTCSRPNCVSYQHLALAQPGYYAEGKEQIYQPCGQRGEERPHARLKADDIPRIFHWHRVRGYSAGEIARHCGVNATTIKHVLRRETWRHVKV